MKVCALAIVFTAIYFKIGTVSMGEGASVGRL